MTIYGIRVTRRYRANHFDGYQWTYNVPKGKTKVIRRKYKTLKGAKDRAALLIAKHPELKVEIVSYAVNVRLLG